MCHTDTWQLHGIETVTYYSSVPYFSGMTLTDTTTGIMGHPTLKIPCINKYMFMHVRLINLTPSQQEEEPPFLSQRAEDQDQHEVQHYTLTQHPAKHCRKQVMQEGSHHHTRSLCGRERPRDEGIKTIAKGK